jgi:hypothetical protein
MHYAVKYLMFASSLSLFACGPEGSQPLAAVDDDGIAHASQAVTPTQNDRPAAAIVARVVNGQTELWVFACGADHRMRRRVQRANGTWGSWIVVASSFRCFSAPSIGKWIGGTPSETIGVYYRGTNTTDGPGNRLIEAWYASDGSASATDLSAHTGFVIAGTPAVVDAVDRTGMSQRMAVAVKHPNGEVSTFDLYQGAWHVRPVTYPASGATVVAMSDDFGVSYGQYAKNYFSVQVGATEFAAFTRSTWTAGYSFHKSIQDATFRGVMTFGRPDSACLPYGCMMLRLAPSQSIYWQQLDPSSNANAIWSSVAATGTPYSMTAGDTANIAMANPGGSGAVFQHNFVRSTDKLFVTGVASAPTLVVNGASTGPTAAAVYANRNPGDDISVRRLVFVRFDESEPTTAFDLEYPGGLLTN